MSRFPGHRKEAQTTSIRPEYFKHKSFNVPAILARQTCGRTSPKKIKEYVSPRHVKVVLLPHVLSYPYGKLHHIIYYNTMAERKNEENGEKKSLNFIEQIVENDLSEGKNG